jgi:hypothetical protein
MDYAINFRAIPTIPVAESNRIFPVGRIYCVGRNYAEHARESIDWPPMDADERRSRLDQITEKIIGCVHQVSNVLGPGFLEKVYENALVVELQQSGLQVAQQHRIIGVHRRSSAASELDPH